MGLGLCMDYGQVRTVVWSLGPKEQDMELEADLTSWASSIGQDLLFILYPGQVISARILKFLKIIFNYFYFFIIIDV